VFPVSADEVRRSHLPSVAYDLTRLVNIVGTKPLMAAIVA
jgi:hypothetical protein